MDISTSGGSWNEVECNWLIVGLTESPDLSGPLGELDTALGGTVSRLIEAGDLKGKLAELLPMHDASELAADRILFVGLGKQNELTRARFNKAMMSAVRKVSSKDDVSAAICLDGAAVSQIGISAAAETAATAIVIGSQGQDSLKSEPGHFALSAASIVVADGDDAEVAAAVDRGVILGESINLTRELVNLPPQMIYPESFAKRAQTVAADLGLKVDVLVQSDLEAEKMGALLAVSQGSSSNRGPRVVAVSYEGAGEDAPTLAIVGKGVTFDSGGLSIKPSDGMITMKCDMAGAATALGAVAAIARLKLPVNVVGYMGLVENMISGSSYKLGD
ncbi:MAG: leucyl aminopeptidase, partial [Porticoccaceae bacterium]